jgi:hypothetical protein
MIRRAPWWFPPISFVGMAAVLVLVSVLHPFSATPLMPLQVTGQLFLTLVLVRLFWFWPAFKQWLKDMPVAHRVVFGVLIGGMIFGHYSFNGRSYFPFVVWEIFPHLEPGDTASARQFYGKTASGEKVRLLAEQQFPSLVQIDRIETLDSAYGPGTTDDLALALARMYNAHHAADPVQEVDLVEVTVNLHPPAGEIHAEPPCELLKTYDVSSAPSR